MHHTPLLPLPPAFHPPPSRFSSVWAKTWYGRALRYVVHCCIERTSVSFPVLESHPPSPHPSPVNIRKFIAQAPVDLLACRVVHTCFQVLSMRWCHPFASLVRNTDTVGNLFLAFRAFLPFLMISSAPDSFLHTLASFLFQSSLPAAG